MEINTGIYYLWAYKQIDGVSLEISYQLYMHLTRVACVTRKMAVRYSMSSQTFASASVLNNYYYFRYFSRSSGMSVSK